MKRYQLKVSPFRQWNRICRVIEISGSETLDDLCLVILKAFDFTMEHMYEFCMTNQMYRDNNYMYEPEEPGQPSTSAKIDSLGLVEGQIFSLHYDYGDDWMFAIRVTQITDAPKTKPAVVEAKGYVEQYPGYDMDKEDEEYNEDDEDEKDEALSELRKTNQEYLKLFENDLRMAGLSGQTIDRHLENASYYIDEFIPCFSEGWTMMDGAVRANLTEFFGDYYIYECWRSSPNGLKTTAASIKKFYRCMMEHGYIEADAYQALCALFKNAMPAWLEACRASKDDEPEGWGFLWY